jgi:hypothetical protein
MEHNQHISVGFDEEYVYCRNENLPWYKGDPDRCTRISKMTFNKLTPSQLLEEINRGLEVEQITRVTGYFSLVSHWNSGKLGELKDRYKNGDYFTNLASSSFPAHKELEH